MFGQLPDPLAAAGAVAPEAAGVELLEESLDDVPDESDAAVLLDGVVVEVLESVWADASAAPPPTIAPVSASASKLCRGHFMCLTSSRLRNWRHPNLRA